MDASNLEFPADTCHWPYVACDCELLSYRYTLIFQESLVLVSNCELFANYTLGSFVNTKPVIAHQNLQWTIFLCHALLC